MDSAPATERKVLIVDDDRGLLRLIEKTLLRDGFGTATAASGEAAIGWLDKNEAGLMLLDLKLEDFEGKALIQRLRQLDRCPPFVIITGQGDERVAVEMMKVGALDYVVKDVDFLEFVPDVVRRAFDQLDKEHRLTQAEEQVRLVRSVVDQGFSCVLIAKAELPEPRVVYINHSFEQATGYSPKQVVGRPLSALAGLTSLQERLRTGMPRDERFFEEISAYQTPEGERWGEWRVGPVKDKAGSITHWLIIFRDITEGKRLEKQILEISEVERQRFGQDLHDGLCQHLAGIELMTQALEQRLAGRSKASAAQVGEIARHVRDAISQTRLLARGLSPVTLESEGLMSALQELAGNTEKMFGVNCRFVCEEPVFVHVPAVATHLYRIAQEAVSNAIKHGKAREIVIELRRIGDRAEVSVSDNGVGLPKVPPSTQGMGMSIMRYRAGFIGGSLALNGNPAGGTTVACSVAIKSAPKS